MLTALFLIAVFFGLIQEARFPARMKMFSAYRTRKQAAKRSALVAIPGKSKA